jgi:hypothetical protein
MKVGKDYLPASRDSRGRELEDERLGKLFDSAVIEPY